MEPSCTTPLLLKVPMHLLRRVCSSLIVEDSMQMVLPTSLVLSLSERYPNNKRETILSYSKDTSASLRHNSPKAHAATNWIYSLAKLYGIVDCPMVTARGTA